jgi:transcription elongation factor GreA
MSERAEIYLTREGIEKVREELKQLVEVRRPALADRLHRAIQQGDLSENADYIAAKEEQGFLEGRIQELEAILQRAVLIEEEVPTDHVRIGSRVTVVEEGYDDRELFHVVGSVEADPANGKISYESPLGRALMNHRIGDTVSVEAPAGEIRFRIVALA